MNQLCNGIAYCWDRSDESRFVMESLTEWEGETEFVMVYDTEIMGVG